MSFEESTAIVKVVNGKEDYWATGMEKHNCSSASESIVHSKFLYQKARMQNVRIGLWRDLEIIVVVLHRSGSLWEYSSKELWCKRAFHLLTSTTSVEALRDWDEAGQ